MIDDFGDSLEFEEDNELYYDYGEGFEEDLRSINSDKVLVFNHAEELYEASFPEDYNVLNSKIVNKHKLDDYLLGDDQ